MELFRLIPGDVGRPLTDLSSGWTYPESDGRCGAGAGDALPVEREVSEAGGRWFLARLLPYRTAEDHIAGVVLTLVDITERREATNEELRENEERAPGADLQIGRAEPRLHLLGRNFAAILPLHGEALHGAGVIPEEFLGMTILEALTPAEAKSFGR